MTAPITDAPVLAERPAGPALMRRPAWSVGGRELESGLLDAVRAGEHWTAGLCMAMRRTAVLPLAQLIARDE